MIHPRPHTFAATLLAPAQPTEQAKRPAVASPLAAAGPPSCIADRIHRPDGRIGS